MRVKRGPWERKRGLKKQLGREERTRDETEHMIGKERRGWQQRGKGRQAKRGGD